MKRHTVDRCNRQKPCWTWASPQIAQPCPCVEIPKQMNCFSFWTCTWHQGMGVPSTSADSQAQVWFYLPTSTLVPCQKPTLWRILLNHTLTKSSFVSLLAPFKQRHGMKPFLRRSFPIINNSELCQGDKQLSQYPAPSWPILACTGKSLTTHEVAKQCWINAKTKSAAEGLPSIVSINCMSLKQPGAVFMRALAGFQACDTKPQAQPITYPGLIPT